MDGPFCLPRSGSGTEHLSCGAQCSCGITGAPFEFHHPGCDRARVPYIDHDTLALVEGAVESLVWSRGSGHGDAGAALSCLASIIAQAQSQLPDAVAAAREHDYTWEEIAERLASTPSSTRRRYSAYARWRVGAK